MKFSSFKEYRDEQADVDRVAKFLRIDLTKTLRELTNGLTKLSLSDNFEGFIEEVTVPASSELAIRNAMRNGVIPSYRVFIRGASSTIEDGDTEWTKDFVYLKNTDSSDKTVTVLFLK